MSNNNNSTNSEDHIKNKPEYKYLKKFCDRHTISKGVDIHKENIIGCIVSFVAGYCNEGGERLKTTPNHELLSGELKNSINNFLFLQLPEETTIKQMESLAIRIHNILESSIK